MILKNVTTSYAFINRVDDNGNYRIQFKPDDKEAVKLESEMDKLAKEKNCQDPDWWGSYNSDTGYYGAKCSKVITKKDGSTVEISLKVYNKKAQQLREDEIPAVVNGAIMNIEIEPYYCEYKKKKGIMLGLRSVQLLEYKEYVGDNPYVNEEDDIPFENKGE